MAFAMESMSEEDHAKIFTAESKKLLRNYCIPQDEWDPTKEYRIAVDRQHDVIFFGVEKYAPIDGPQNYLIMLEGSPFVIQLIDFPRHLILPIDLPNKLEHRTLEIRQLIREAFAVHGRYGRGSPESVVQYVNPSFQE
jgi:hypothetical protein